MLCMKDFTYRPINGGYYLYYRGHFIGAGKCDGSKIVAATEAVKKIIDGKGFVGFLAVVRSLEEKKGDIQCTFFGEDPSEDLKKLA